MVIEAVKTAEEVNQVECLPHHRLERPYNNWTAPVLPAHPVIALCETEAEVVFLAQASSPKIDALIALTPQAACQCHLLALPYFKIEDFFDLTAFWTGDEPMLAFQSRWSDKVDEFLWEANPDFRQYGFRPAGHYFFFLKVMIDMLFRAVFGLAHLFISSRPREVVYFASNGTTAVTETLFFQSAYQEVLAAVAKEYGVKLTALSSASGEQRPPAGERLNLRRKVRDILPPALVARFRWFKSVGWKGLVPQGRGDGNSLRVVFSGSPEANLVIQSAQSQGFRHEWLEDVVAPPGLSRKLPADLFSSLPKWWQEINSQSFFRQPFVWCGVDLQEAAGARLRYWWQKVVPAMWQSFMQARVSFQAQRPDVLLIPSLWKPEEHAAFQAARSLEIPTVTYQHGGFEGSCEYIMHDMTETRQSDYRLVYGNGNAAYLKERAGKWNETRAQAVPVGSARLDSLRSSLERRNQVRQRLGIKSGEQVVAYVPTSYQYNWYLGRQSYIGVPYFELLVQVIEVLRKFCHLHFIYKPFPELPADPLTRIIAERCSNCQVVTDHSVFDVVQASDACIIDIPSTGLLEAIMTNKPVLVFSDSRLVALRPEARELLRKRATVSETPEDYLDQIRLFLGSGDFQDLENPNREFLRMYGTYEDNGLSADRAAAALKEIGLGRARQQKNG